MLATPDAEGKKWWKVMFDLDKTIQACAVLFKESGQMSQPRLLKLLYTADRESLKETGRTVTGDQVVAMEQGPVLSRTYNVIKGNWHGVERWSRFIENVGKRDLRLLADPGVDALSPYEVEKLQEVASRFDAVDDWSVVEKTHEYPEWKKNQPSGGTTKEIPTADILDAVGMSEHKDEILREAESYARIEQALAAK